MAIEMEFKEEERKGGVALDFTGDGEETPSSAVQKLPPRKLRRRLLESKSPASAEEIESKLRDADLRRQKFYNLVSNRARQTRNLRVPCQERENHSRIVARCISLSTAYEALDINEKSVQSMPFEQLALKLESSKTIQTVKDLVECLETRLRFSQADSGIPNLENIDHLLNQVAKSNIGKSVSPRSSKGKKAVASSEEAFPNPMKRVPRYPVRVLLCAYMIVGHPDVVFNGNGENEIALVDVASKFVKEFELLIKMMADGRNQISEEETVSEFPNRQSIRSQLEAFDKAWCAYLHQFAMWKVRDAKLLEEDLVKTACNLERSMMHRLSPKQNKNIVHDMKAILHKQVAENQNLLRESIHSLSGDSGLQHMDFALSDVRSKFNVNDCRSSIASPLDKNASHPASSSGSLSSVMVRRAEGHESCSHVSSEDENASLSPSKTAAVSYFSDAMLVSENEILVNEILHTNRNGFSNSLNLKNAEDNSLKVQVRETMEKAFWDAVSDSIKQDEPDFSWVIKLIREVRDELCEISPQSLKQEIDGTIDIEILTQVLRSGTLDTNYLGKILDFALVTLRKLSAPAKDSEIQTTHQNLLQELQEISHSSDGLNTSSALLMVKGLRFVLEQIQTLKKEVSLARIKMTEPVIKGPAGVDYLKKAFTKRYGPPGHASTSLPLTRQWLSTVHVSAEQEWEEHTAVLASIEGSSSRFSPGPAPATLRTGGRMPNLPADTAPGNELPECRGEKIDLCIRLGLLKLVNEVTGLTMETLPETLKLNFSRLRAVQSQFQKIVVISTSVLVLQQTLVSDNLLRNSSEMDDIVSKCVQKLIRLLDSDDNAGISEIIDTMIDFSDISDHVSSPNEVQAKKQVMENMLRKSLQAGDVVYKRISAAVHLAARGAVLGGSGNKGRQLVETALKRVGAANLSDILLKAAEVLIVVATVSSTVHGSWYVEVLKSL